ncbi:hypothetical protein P4S72_02095 [Vibrio sp. PP-XX7]
MENAQKKKPVNQTKQLKAHGMNVVQPSPELTAALKKIGAQMAKEWEKTAGPDGAKLLKSVSKLTVLKTKQYLKPNGT